MIRGLLVDLDDTLYDYEPCEARGRGAVRECAKKRFSWSDAQFEERWREARAKVKARFHGPSAHHRLLYMVELLGAEGSESLSVAREWERSYWSAYLEGSALRNGARELLDACRGHGMKIAIVTDLVLEVQLWKLAHFGLFSLIDALVVSEEVGHDKPHRAPFELAAARMGVALDACVVVGDNEKTDGDGAKACAIPFFHVRTPQASGGLTLDEILSELRKMNRWND